MKRWGRLIAVCTVLLGAAVVLWLVLQKEGEFQDETAVSFLTALFTVEFAESEALFEAIDKEIEAVLEKNEQEIVTFTSKAIEETAMDKYGRYLTADGFDTLLHAGTLTGVYQLAYTDNSDYKIDDIRKLQEKKQEGGYEVSYIVEFGQYERSSNVQQAWWSTEVTVEVIKEGDEWKIADMTMEQDVFNQTH